MRPGYRVCLCSHRFSPPRPTLIPWGARVSVTGYFLELLAERARSEDDDAISTLAREAARGEFINTTEAADMLGVIMIAGNETTANLIGNGLWALMRHPDEMERLREEPERARDAINDSPALRQPGADGFQSREERGGDWREDHPGRRRRDPAGIVIPTEPSISVADASARLSHELRGLSNRGRDGHGRVGLHRDGRSTHLRRGEREKTVSVPVLDDAHDEGSETLTLTLSNPSGAYLADRSAIGTINNTDPMPKAWLVRFGRTVGSQVVDALDARLEGAAGAHVTVGGMNVIGTPGIERKPEDNDPFGLPEWAQERRAFDAARRGPPGAATP